MKLLVLIFLLLTSISIGSYYLNQRNILFTDSELFTIEKLKEKAKIAEDYCQTNNFNTDFCILIDMGIHSGLNRLFVYDFNSDSVLFECMVGHGCCQNQWSSDESKDEPLFSNTEGSHCSSVGKYRIGERGYSNWGINIKYFLYGLENTNSNAFKRQIVLHGWDIISDNEVFPEGTPEGWGCPTVSNNSMKKIDNLLKSDEKAVLLWIYQ